MRKILTLCASSLVLAGCLDSDSKDDYQDINRAPVASDLMLTTQTETPIVESLSATDADGDGLTFALSAEPELGAVTVSANGDFTYTPFDEITGTDSFTFTVSDGQAHAVTGSVSITIEALEVSVTAAIRDAFSQAPTAEPIKLNGRIYVQDATNPAEFDDLLVD
ncbi:Ig-like domain-containing protein [Alteromonas gilva]|uniref:Ig-like domain-containing protein n=1 Tax=Alteromonas gilva TaxID=2987522 RepID=A0ABT5L5K8_9ALTE|nr:Ig-like domain-containing protein [Alteromonas gilva]MDC8832338.1 Ig-like domain-containing protein [Alteromonas gilva]